jgi:cell division protein FtsL
MATAKRKPTVNVSRQPRRQVSSRRVFGTCFTGTVLVLLGVLLYLWPHMRLVELGYEHSALRTQRTQLLQQQKEYEVEIASLSRLGRIEKMAEQMGLRAPQVSQVIYLRQTPEGDEQQEARP